MNELILDEIKNKLNLLCANVYYGIVDDSMRETIWNYIVFDRVSTSANANKTGYIDKFAVHIINENFIPEGVYEQVVESMCSISGMRLSDADATYTYVLKPNTNVVVEMLSVEFIRARKKVIA